jgi:hypothetical protein
VELRELARSDEVRDLSDEHYMLLSLDLANWRAGEDVPDVANVAWQRLTTDTSAWTLRWAVIRTDPAIAVTPEALEHGKRLRADLERFLHGGEKWLQALRSTRDNALEGVQVVRTQLRVSERGRLEHLHSYAAGTGDGPRGLFLAFLLDPERRFGTDLRRCRLPACGRFFVVPPFRKGGRIPNYCPGTDHQRRHDAMRSPERSRRNRPKPAAKHK